MPNWNHVEIAGHLGRDPELKEIGEKRVPLCTMSVATTYGKKDDPKKETSWHKLEIWGKIGEEAYKSYGKGDAISIKGRIRYSKVGDKYYTSILVSEIVPLKRKEVNEFIEED